MALGDAYITDPEFRTYLGLDDDGDSTLTTAAATAATAWVEQFTGRQFNKTTAATARVYRADDPCMVRVDDFHTTTDLVIKTDTANNGTYDQTWAATDYVLEPTGGIRLGVSGWPYKEIVAVGDYRFPTVGGRRRVQVTAQWGWNAVPGPVKLATQVVAAFVFNLKNSPLGVASFADSGIIRVRDVPQAAMLLAAYQDAGDLVG